MVMHARKLPRLNDGYFDKSQSHSYESTNKYSKPSDRNSERIRDTFTSSNSDSTGRIDNADHRNSPRCHKSYAQRLKEKDHHDDAPSKSPAMKTENRTSGKEMHKSSSLESEGSSVSYQSNHDRNNAEVSSANQMTKLNRANSEGERRLQFGDWSEHISSSGKKYYYNCRTEISQWEKPKELIELERQQAVARLSHDLNRSRDRLHDRQGSSAVGNKNAHTDEISTSPENSDLYSCRSDALPHKNSYVPSQHPTPAQAAHLLSPSQVTLSNLPKLISQLAGTKGLPNLSELSPQEALKTIQQALQLTKQVTTLSQNVSGEISIQKSPAHSQNQVISQNHHNAVVPTTTSNSTSSAAVAGQASLNSTNATNAAPSLPQTVPEEKPVAEQDRASPGNDSPTSSVSSLQSLGAAGTSSLATAALKPSVPSLTPSLANYYREDLITHVVGWQADHAERQANRYFEEGHNIGSLNCTQVSAELKMARALVRLAEIQATLQEQRILFLRQQTKELEDWRSLNSFMSDS